MPWSGGSFTRSNGTYTGSDTWNDDATNGFDIEATRHDTHDQDLADGINSCLHKGGQNAATGNISMGGNKLTNLGAPTSDNDAARKTYVDGLFSSPTFTGGAREDYEALSGTTPALNCNLSNVFGITLSGNTTFSFSNVPASGTTFALTLRITQGGSAYTITWPAAVKWSGGSAPAAPGAGETNIYTMFTHDGGTTWYAFLAGNDMS